MIELIGCQPKAPYDIIPLEGIATWQGKPIPKDFLIQFAPQDGKRQSSAYIQSDDGSFKVVHTASLDGVPVGKCKVTVSWAGPMESSPPKEFQPLLKQYGFETQGLELELTKPDKKFQLDFP
jgi:hypothetical protein